MNFLTIYFHWYWQSFCYSWQIKIFWGSWDFLPYNRLLNHALLFHGYLSILQNSYLFCCIYCCILWFNIWKIDYLTAFCKDWVNYEIFMWEFQYCNFDKTYLMPEISKEGGAKKLMLPLSFWVSPVVQQYLF